MSGTTALVQSGGMGRSLYVETVVRGDMERLWRLTQDAGCHTRWDLRFSVIEDVPAPDGSDAQAFRYALRLPGLTVAGTGTTVGERVRPDGTRTSALRFSSPDSLSLIRRGSGWWRYVPSPAGTRFITGYDYEPGWGQVGRAIDRVLFRRLMGWATAWSFDRLRLWVDDGVSPERAVRLAAGHALLRLAVVGVGAVTLLRGPRPLAVVALLAALPPPAGAPRARRCLRRPSDATGRTPPATLSTLREPT